MAPSNTALRGSDTPPFSKKKLNGPSHPTAFTAVNTKEELWRQKLKSAQLKIDLLKQENKHLSTQNSELKLKQPDSGENHNRLFSIISHDLRSPLSSILDLTKLVVDNPDDFTKEELVTNFKNFESSFDRIYRLVENMLYWSSLQLHRNEFNPELNPLSEIVEETIDLVKQRASEKDISIHNHIASSDYFYADYNMVGLVLRNLVYNAIKFTRKGGNIEIASKTSNTDITVFVKDDGVGISPQNQQKIFSSINKVTTSGTNGESGTGIGLSLCRDMLRKNGGDIGFTSEVDKGSCFHFTLPIDFDGNGIPKSL